MTDNIIKLLNLEDSDLIVEGPVITGGKKVLTLTKELVPAFCPICGTKMHSKGIYTRTVNHPVLQDGTQLILKLTSVAGAALILSASIPATTLSVSLIQGAEIQISQIYQL